MNSAKYSISMQNKSQTFPKVTAQDKTTKLRHFMDTRSSLRQVRD